MALSKNPQQPNSLADNDLVVAIKKSLGGKEIFGKEENELNEEFLRQETIKAKIKKWLRWYGGKQYSVLEAH